MPTRTDLQKLANLRLKDAEALFAAGLYDGCTYLCGYVVELALKACICKTLNRTDYLDSHPNLKTTFKTHDFDVLAILAGIKDELDANKSAALGVNWNTATAWKPELRYEPVGTYGRQETEDRLNSIRDNRDGVLKWLSQRW